MAQADAIAREREAWKLRQAVYKIDDIVARGEIRVSGLYTGDGGKAKRWRMVDPKSDRTIAYIELPAGSAIDPVQYYGKFVGVRAVSYELLHGTVPPLPVYVINDIQVLDPNAPQKAGVISREEIASPNPPLAAPPATQPSAEKASASQAAASPRVVPNEPAK
jgi:hypothetical protein